MSERGNSGGSQHYCTNCGAQLRPGNAFCTSCGERMYPSPGDAPQGSFPTDRLPALKLAPTVFGLGGLAVVVLLVLVAFGGEFGASEEEYLEDVRSSYESIESSQLDTGVVMDDYYEYGIGSSGTVAREVTELRRQLEGEMEDMEDRTPPSGYGDFHEQTLEGWEELTEGLQGLEDAVRRDDYEVFEDGERHIRRAEVILEDADDELPENDHADGFVHYVF